MHLLNPSLSVDCVIFGMSTEEQLLKILVYERDIFPRQEPDNKNLKFPGSLVPEGLDLDEAAHGVLRDLTGLKSIVLKQFQCFGNPGRIKFSEEREWAERHYGIQINHVVTVAYYALIRIDHQNPDQAQIKDKLKWINVDDAGNLAFDHSLILKEARKALQQDLILQNVMAFELLPEKFTLLQLQSMYELILGHKLDKRNFRKKIRKATYIIPLNEKQKGVAHKPAMLYRFDSRKFKSKENGAIRFII